MFASPDLERSREHDPGKVTFVELFFDLVFVFAITQLSHLLLGRLTPFGALQTLLLLMAIWWVWIYTSWVTNWLDPERTPVRLMIFALMLAGLALSGSLPKAFEEKGLIFASAYAVMQIGRSAFMVWAMRGSNEINYRNFQRILIWLCVSGVFWIAGGFAAGGTRMALWVVALGIEYVGPSCGFVVPGFGRSTTADWKVEGGHIAERCALFIIIALGESVLMIGATFSELQAGPANVAAFALSFLGSVAMWWIYFNVGAQWGHHRIADDNDPGRLARLAFTYLHLPLVAGIVVAAVADEIIVAHPLEHTSAAVIACILGGPALYLFGNLLFKRVISGFWALSHLVGLALTALCILPAFAVVPLVTYALTTAILIGVAVWETRSIGHLAQAPEIEETGGLAPKIVGDEEVRGGSA
jgi:low temperature requirement protein LtrA